MFQLALLVVWALVYLTTSGLLKLSLSSSPEIPWSDLPKPLQQKLKKVSRTLRIPQAELRVKRDSRPYGLQVPMWASSRIYISAKAVDLFSVDELCWIVGHECGHAALHHSWWHAVYSLAFLTVSLVLSRLFSADLARLVVMIAAAVWWGMVSIYIQKQFEKQANVFSLRYAAMPKAQISATKVFAQYYNHGKLAQSWWKRTFSGQVSYRERIKQGNVILLRKTLS